MRHPGSRSGYNYPRFLLAWGFGVAEARVKVMAAKHPRGSVANGVVEIQGGRAVQQMRSLLLHLKTFNANDDFQSRVLVTHDLARRVEIAPQQMLAFPFSLLIPDDAMLTRYALKTPSVGCQLVAEAALEETWRARKATTVLYVTLHREIEAIFGALRMLGFKEASWFAHHLLRPSEDEQSTATFDAPEELQEQLSNLSVFLSISGNHLVGKVQFAIRQATLGGQVKALVGGNRQEDNLLIPRAALISERGGPNPWEAIPYLKQKLARALALPDNPEAWMLRPAMAPEEGGRTLLRPVQPSASPSDSNLLRPTTSPSDKTP